MLKKDRPKWTELDIASLREGFRENLSVSDLAGQLLRTETDILEKATELEIKLRTI